MKPLSGFMRSAALLLTSLALLSGCGGGDDSTSSTGTLSVAMTDAPACGYDNVFVTVKEVRVHRSEEAVDGDEGWQVIPVVNAFNEPDPKRIDLLELTNGELAELGETVLPAGTYTQMRLVLADNKTTPNANAVVLTDTKNEVELTTPSGQQTGLKMNLNVTVEPDKVARVVIDFDACKSVVKAGASGQYLLKPVLSATTVISDMGQSIIGYLDTATLGATTAVSAQVNGMVVKSTLPDTTGKFVLYPVPMPATSGTYDLVIASTGKATAVMTGVPVYDTENTYVGSETVRIAMTDSAVNDATGTVSLDGKVLDTGAAVRALQALYNGPAVEVASMQVDALTGEYGFALPIVAPQVTAYTAGATAITFAADSTDTTQTAAGKYTLDASIAGLTPQTAVIDLLSGPVATNFSFTTPPAP